MKGKTVLSLVSVVAFFLFGMNPAFASEKHKKKPDPVIVKNGPEKPVPTQIVNTDPVPVINQSALITTSNRAVSILVGETTNSDVIPVATCPEGERFLVTGLYASPNLQEMSFSDAISLPAWAVSFRTAQDTVDGGFYTRVMVGSQAHIPASAAVPGGVAALLGDPNNFNVDFELAAAQNSNVVFVVHVTGFCGVAFIQP